MKYMRTVLDGIRQAPVVTRQDLLRLLAKAGASKGYLNLTIHNLLKKGSIKRITRGAYTAFDDVQLVGFAFRPFYYGLQDALSLMNLWEQETVPVIITPRKVRGGVRVFDGANYLVRRLERKMFFGFELMKYGDFWIPVSDAEKTLIDFAYFNEPLPSEALYELRQRIDVQQLERYLKKCGPRLRKKVERMVLSKRALPAPA